MEKTVDELSVEDIFRLSIEMNDKRFPIFREEDSCATLMLSSGSSGRPKAIVRSNRNHLLTLGCMSHEEMMPLTEDDVMLSNGFCHICGQRNLFSSIIEGALLAVAKNDETHTAVFDAIKQYDVTSAVLMPTQLLYMVKNGYTKDTFPSLRDVMTGAAPMSAELHSAVQKTFAFDKFRNSKS